jgi:hypothetical protein
MWEDRGGGGEMHVNILYKLTFDIDLRNTVNAAHTCICICYWVAITPAFTFFHLSDRQCSLGNYKIILLPRFYA